jgi:hypothetical protein
MYLPKNNNEGPFLSVSYIFLKFDGSSNMKCDVPCGTTKSYFHLLEPKT